MKKKTTIADIAKELDVSPATVSRALRDHPRISDATKEVVRKLAKRLNYQPNTIASALRKGKSNIIGVIVPTSDRQFFASIIRGIEEIIRNENYNLIICQSDEQTSKEKKIIDTLLQIQVDGIIASVAKETTDYDHFNKIWERGVPLVLYDRIGESINADAVVINDYMGGYMAVEHLIQQGCRKIAHFAGQQHIGIYQERMRGYKEALKAYNIPFNENWVIESDLIDETQKILASGKKMANQLLKLPDKPDAIFSASDFAAMGAIHLLNEKKISIPDEIALVGFSNDFASSIIEPGLTSIDQYAKQMGNMAAKHFLNQIRDYSETFTPEKTLLTPDLVFRSSSIRKHPINSDNPIQIANESP